MKKLEKVVCIEDGYFSPRSGGKQFCTKGKEYPVINQYDDGFDINNDKGNLHSFIEGDKWFKLVFEEDLILNNIIEEEKVMIKENFCVGDKVRVLNNIQYTDLKKNDIAEIISISVFDGQCVRITTKECTGYVKESEIEVIKVSFKVGDKVEVIEKLVLGRIKIGDTAVVEEVSCGDSLKIRMDKDDDYWYARPDKLKLIQTADTKHFELITDGTTTKVRLKGGKTGTAKLFHEDTYNRGYGICVALGRALDIDLVAEVQKVVAGYKVEPTQEEIKEFADSTAFPTKFKVGDIVKGNAASTKKYGFTTEKMTQARVTKVNGNMIAIEILEHENSWNIGLITSVEAQYFDLLTPTEVLLKKAILKEERKFKNGDRVKLISNSRRANLNIGDIAVIIDVRDQSSIRLEKDGDSSCRNVNPEDIELVKESKEIVVDEPVVEEFKVGDYVYYTSKYEGDYYICKIDEIKNTQLFGAWSEGICILPKTISEFKKLDLGSYGFMYSDDQSSATVKRLLLIDDTVVVLKVNQELWDKFLVHDRGVYCGTEEAAMKFMKYCEEKGFVWNGYSKAPTSDIRFNKTYGTTYYGNDNARLTHGSIKDEDDITFEELFPELSVIEKKIIPEPTYEVDQEIDTREEMESFLKLGGKVKGCFGSIYKLKNNVLRYKNSVGDKFDSAGYDQITMPVIIHKLPKTDIK